MISIEMGLNSDATTKQKGDLLEELAKQLLESQHYEVETEIRKTGVELDLLCKHKANPNKNIYVECKAYAKDKKIDANIIFNLIGKKTQKKLTEAWLISTSELGKEAKGVVAEMQEEENNEYTFYSPDKLIEALADAHIIVKDNIIDKSLNDHKLTNGKYSLNNHTLLITNFGYFYVSIIKESGNDKGVIVHNAKNAEIINDELMLEKLKILITSFSSLDFTYINNIMGKVESSIDSKKIIKIDQIKLNSQYLERINDTGIKLTHPNKNELTLDDIFVFQDLQDIENKKKIRVNSKKLLDINNIPKAVIFGEEVSGKTSLIFTLQKKLNDNNFIPLYFNAKNLKSSDYDKFVNRLVNNFKKQYQDIDKPEIIKLLDSNEDNFVILIDNFEALSIKKLDARARFLEMLSEKFNNIFGSRQLKRFFPEDF